MEMGRCLHGFYHRSSQNPSRQQCRMGHGGHADQHGPLHSNLNHISGRSISSTLFPPTLFPSSYIITWVSKQLIHFPQIYQLWNHSKVPKDYPQKIVRSQFLDITSVTSYHAMLCGQLTEDWASIGLQHLLKRSRWHWFLPLFAIYRVVLFRYEKVEREIISLHQSFRFILWYLPI